MNKKIFVVFSIVLFMLAACAPQTAPIPEQSDTINRQISVVGEGLVNVAPDIAYINIGVHSEADTVSNALQQNNAQAQAIITALMNNGVAEKDIQTSTFSISSRTETSPQGNTSSTIFLVDNSVFVTVRSLNDIGTLLDAVVAAGANNINGISFDKQDKSAAESNARSLAVESAQKQAEEFANLAGVSLGQVISIATSNSTPLQPLGAENAIAAPAASVPISQGQIQVNARVTIVYALQ